MKNFAVVRCDRVQCELQAGGQRTRECEGECEDDVNTALSG